MKQLQKIVEGDYDHIFTKSTELNKKYAPLFGKKYRPGSGNQEWTLVGCNDLGVPYFTKGNSKTQYTVADYDRKWLDSELNNLKNESGMVRLEKVLESFSYTGDWEKDFNDEHPIMPDVVADTVAEKRADPKEAKELADHLMKRFADTYKANKDWGKKIVLAGGNKGRDLLYSFMNHWADSWLKS